jgi:hypothetical protein
MLNSQWQKHKNMRIAMQYNIIKGEKNAYYETFEKPFKNSTLFCVVKIPFFTLLLMLFFTLKKVVERKIVQKLCTFLWKKIRMKYRKVLKLHQ